MVLASGRRGVPAMFVVYRISSVLMSLTILGASGESASSQNRTSSDRHQSEDVPSLIDKLQNVAEGDIGYMPNASGSGFLPLGKSEPGSMLLGSSDRGARRMQKPARSSDTMCEVVKRGMAAVPELIAHLDDKLRHQDHDQA